VIIVESAIPTMESVAPVSAPVFDEPAKGAKPVKTEKPAKSDGPSIKTKKDLESRKTEAPKPASKSKPVKGLDEDDPRLF
jgi:hypothetical protein